MIYLSLECLDWIILKSVLSTILNFILNKLLTKPMNWNWMHKEYRVIFLVIICIVDT